MKLFILLTLKSAIQAKGEGRPFSTMQWVSQTIELVHFDSPGFRQNLGSTSASLGVLHTT
jgi:hypothetical protein